MHHCTHSDKSLWSKCSICFLCKTSLDTTTQTDCGRSMFCLISLLGVNNLPASTRGNLNDSHPRGQKSWRNIKIITQIICNELFHNKNLLVDIQNMKYFMNITKLFTTWGKLLMAFIEHKIYSKYFVTSLFCNNLFIYLV